MKIYDVKSFIVGLIALAAAVFELFHFGGAKSVVWIVFFLYLGIRVIKTSLSEESEAADE